MNPYSFPPLICSIVAALLGLFIYFKNRKSFFNITFALLCLTTLCWQFSWFILFNTTQEKLASILVKIGYTGIIFMPISIFHFCIEFTEFIYKKITVYIIYSIGMFFLAALWLTRFFINGYYKYSWGYYPRANILHIPYMIFLATLVFLCCYLFLRNSRDTEVPFLKRLQSKYLIGACIIWTLSGSDFIVNYGIAFYPIGFIFVIISLFIIAYAIIRYHLMDIEVLVKKSLVFAGTFIFAFGIFVTITLLVSSFIGGNKIVSLAVSALIITIFLRPLETWLVDSTDKFLFQKKYAYKEIIKTFIDEIITKLNLDEVINSTLKLLDETLHPYASGIFILNKVDDKYQLYNSLGLEDKNIIFASDSRLVVFLKQFHNPAVIKQIDGIIGVNPEISSEMSKLKAVLVLPLMLHDDLIGFISLGRKKSDEEYTKDDLDVLQDLARTESVAVGNAQLMQEAAQAERSAAIGTMAAGIYHEIGNPLNIINTKIQVFLTGIERGFYKDKTREEIVQECGNILHETLNQTNRIADITRRLSNFAKPSKEFKPQLVNISEEIDEALAVVGHDLELERIKINKQISAELPQILADRREMQQIFFNLIRNAGQAIEGAGVITIRALPSVDAKVRIEVEDSGKGIPEDKKSRIFEPFFTTKGLNKGTGLGLSIVRQLVWRNKGEITFRSQAEVGTTFILEFPKGVK